MAWLSSGGGRLCGSNHPRAGIEAGPLRVKVAGQATDGVGYGTGLKDRGEAVGLRAQWGSSTAPASGRTPNASRSRRRRGESRQRMECGGLSPLCEASGVKAGLLTGCYHHRVEAGALGACDEGGRCARGKGGQEGWSICRSTRSGGTMLRGSVSVSADRPVLGSGWGGSSVGFGDLLVQRAPVSAVPAQPPRQGGQKLKCAALERRCS